MNIKGGFLGNCCNKRELFFHELVGDVEVFDYSNEKLLYLALKEYERSIEQASPSVKVMQGYACYLELQCQNTSKIKVKKV